MSAWYLDTSAALKLLVAEAESAALVRTIQDEAPDLVACLLLETELRRAVPQLPAISHDHVTDLLDHVDVHDVPASLFREAGLLPGTHLRSLDALHLAAATRIGVECLLTYDRLMGAAAHEIGVRVLAPA